SASGFRFTAKYCRTSGGIFYVGQRGEVFSHSACDPSGKEILVLFRLEIFCRSGTSAKALSITKLLDIAKSGCNPTVSIGVISVEGHADLSITAGVHFALIQNRLYMGVHHLRSLTAVRIEEVAVCIGLVIRTVNVSVTQRQLQVGRNLSTPLGDRVLLGLLHSSLDGID